MKGGLHKVENGWLKPILEQAVADRETWPAWQRGLEIEASDSQTQVAESGTHDEEDAGDHAAAA
jgi:hypothetical protein